MSEQQTIMRHIQRAQSFRQKADACQDDNTKRELLTVADYWEEQAEKVRIRLKIEPTHH